LQGREPASAAMIFRWTGSEAIFVAFARHDNNVKQRCQSLDINVNRMPYLKRED